MKFKRFDVWVPAKDQGVDLLITSRDEKRVPTSLQVKFSRSFRPKYVPPKQLLAMGWFTLKPDKIRKSRADVWVLVTLTRRHEPHFVGIPTIDLRARMPRNAGGIWYLYLTSLRGKRCYDLRGMPKEERASLGRGVVPGPERDWSKYFDNWDCLRAT